MKLKEKYKIILKIFYTKLIEFCNFGFYNKSIEFCNFGF